MVDLIRFIRKCCAGFKITGPPAISGIMVNLGVRFIYMGIYQDVIGHRSVNKDEIIKFMEADCNDDCRSKVLK
jgi:hypothetical protein